MYCNQCGKHNPKDSSFCQSCGAKIVKVGEEHKKHDEQVTHHESSDTSVKELNTSTQEKKKSNYSHWLFWWILDKDILAMQVREYKNLGTWHASRKIASVALIFSAIVTTLFILFGGWDSSAFFDAACFLILALFIYRGHRWAMIIAMILWTYEKIYSISTSPSSSFVSIIWWAIYMHAFYEAFKVEQLRRKKEYVL